MFNFKEVIVTFVFLKQTYIIGVNKKLKKLYRKQVGPHEATLVVQMTLCDVTRNKSSLVRR